jgi:hypothetical protein
MNQDTRNVLNDLLMLGGVAFVFLLIFVTLFLLIGGVR